MILVRSCLHEAGHSVLAAHLGAEKAHATVQAGQLSGGHATWTLPAAIEEPSGRLIQELAITFGGYAAEAVLEGRLPISEQRTIGPWTTWLHEDAEDDQHAYQRATAAAKARGGTRDEQAVYRDALVSTAREVAFGLVVSHRTILWALTSELAAVEPFDIGKGQRGVAVDVIAWLDQRAPKCRQGDH